MTLAKPLALPQGKPQGLPQQKGHIEGQGKPQGLGTPYYLYLYLLPTTATQLVIHVVISPGGNATASSVPVIPITTPDAMDETSIPRPRGQA